MSENQADYRITYLLDKCEKELFKLVLKTDGQFVFMGDQGTEFPIKGSLPKKITAIQGSAETIVTRDKFLVKNIKEKKLEQTSLLDQPGVANNG